VAGSKDHQRRCQGCGTPLACDNRTRLCSPCSRREVQEASGAPAKPDGFWQCAALQDALAARHFGQVLYAYRHEHRPVLTQANLGRWLGLTPFGWFSAQPSPQSSTRAVGMTDVQVIREMTQTFRRLDNRFGGGHARSAITNYLASDVLPLLREGRYRSDVRRELSGAVAELDQLAGWMAYDVGDTISGYRHLSQAMRLCQDFGDDALAGEMLAGMSHQAAFRGSSTLAIDLARAAKDKGKQAGMPALVSESAVMEAHGLALTKDVKGCLAALRESERAFAAAEGRDRSEWLAYLDDAYLAAKFGRCFRDLGRPVEAERFARRSLDMNDGYVRGRLFNLALLGSALADQRKVEEACETGGQAVRMLNDDMRAAGVRVQPP
jgi:tetratricopeptide (TPR) repeat protein